MAIFTDTRKFRQSKKSVLFVTSQLRQREIKMAYALKSLGWTIGLIYYKTTPFIPDTHFDFVWEVATPKQAHTLAMRLRPQVVHVFSGAIDEYVLKFCRDKVAPVVIDLNDIFTPALMDYCPERYKPTKEALGLADGVCGRDLQVKIAEKVDQCKLPDNLLLFPEYCWNHEQKVVSEKLKEGIHIVSVGTISLETYGMYDCCYLELVKMILDHGVHFHIYPPWSYRKDFSQFANVSFEKDYADFIALEKNNPYLHIHDSLPVEKLITELSQYDFGIISGGSTDFGQKYTHFKPAYVEACYSGRIADYLDAGLPILINEEVVFDYWLIKRYGVCIDLKAVLKPNFKAYLEEFKQSQAMSQRIAVAREKLSILENAERIGRFYSKIIDTSIIYPNKYYAHLTKEVMNLLPRGIKKVGRYLRA